MAKKSVKNRIYSLIYQPGTENLHKSHNKFPIIRLTVGALIFPSLCYCFLGESHYDMTFWDMFFFGIIMGLIPMGIAYVCNTKNANKVYWVTFAAISIPIGIIWIIAFFMACSGERINDKSKKHSNPDKKD